MNWNQIERKWEEMARRVQPLSSSQSAGMAKSTPVEPDGLVAKSEVASKALLATAMVAKPYE